MLARPVRHPNTAAPRAARTLRSVWILKLCRRGSAPRARSLGLALAFGALLAASSTLLMPSTVAADGVCLVGAVADSTRPNALNVMFAGCVYVVTDKVPLYVIELEGPGYSRQLYQGDGDAPNASGSVTWTISGLPAGTYQVVSSGVVSFDARGNPVLGASAISIRVFGAVGASQTPAPTSMPPTRRITATATPRFTPTPSPVWTPTPRPTATQQPRSTPPTPERSSRPTRAPSPAPTPVRSAGTSASSRLVGTPRPVAAAAVTSSPATASGTPTGSPPVPSLPAVSPRAPSAAVAQNARQGSGRQTFGPTVGAQAASALAGSSSPMPGILTIGGTLVALAAILTGILWRRRRAGG